MEPIINPVSVELLKAELTPDKKLRNTNKGHNELYVVTAHNAPCVMREIGRLRELAFRAAGCGTGSELDVDHFDSMENPCSQLIVWDPDNEAIVGGYRYICGDSVQSDAHGQPIITSSHLFHYSHTFLRDYLPYTMELGRAFVAPQYQSINAGVKALFALDNLWDGLGAVMFAKPGMRYYLGKMTMCASFDHRARDLILHFLNKHFADRDALACAFNPLMVDTPKDELDSVLSEKEFKQDYKLLKKSVKKLGLDIPPLINSYMGISPSIKIFGSALNDEFADAVETGILVDFNDIYEEKRIRHINSFLVEKAEGIKLRYPMLASYSDAEIVREIVLRREERHRRFVAWHKLRLEGAY